MVHRRSRSGALTAQCGLSCTTELCPPCRLVVTMHMFVAYQSAAASALGVHRTRAHGARGCPVLPHVWAINDFTYWGAYRHSRRQRMSDLREMRLPAQTSRISRGSLIHLCA